MLLRNLSIFGTFGISNKSESGGGGRGPNGGGGGFGGKKLLLSPLLKNSFFSLSLFSVDWIYRSVMSGALSKNLLKSFF